MKRYVGIVFGILLITSCLDDKDCGCFRQTDLGFEMKDIVYSYDEDGAVLEYQPYYRATNRLDVYTFKGEVLDSVAFLNHDYCREHPVIPWNAGPGNYTFLFIANLLDVNALTYLWDAQKNLEVWLNIVNHEQPPGYLLALNRVDVYGSQKVPVELKLLISRLEVEVLNPPQWVTGFNFTVQNVARAINDKLVLRDTTSIDQYQPLQYTESGVYRVGINTFPTYSDYPAVVTVKLAGRADIKPLVIEDNRMVFRAGRIIRLIVEFKPEGTVKIFLNVSNKWEVIDEGKIDI